MSECNFQHGPWVKYDNPMGEDDVYCEKCGLDKNSYAYKLELTIIEWEENARNWVASPEAGQRLEAYRELTLEKAHAEARVKELETFLQSREDCMVFPQMLIDLGIEPLRLRKREGNNG